MKMLSFLSITSLLVMVMACKTTVDTTSTTKAEIDAKETVVTCTNGGERGNEHYTEVYKNPAIYARAYEDNRICEPVMFSQGETYKRFLDYCYDEQASRNIKHTIKLMKRRFGQVGCDEAYEGLKKTKSLAFNTDDDIRDLRSLAEFKNLETLDLSNNGNLFHLEPISGLTSLTTLYINWTGVANITPLANLTGLKKLFLSYNNVSDISPLANFTKLEELYLSNNKIEDLTSGPLAHYGENVNHSYCAWISRTRCLGGVLAGGFCC